LLLESLAVERGMSPAVPVSTDSSQTQKPLPPPQHGRITGALTQDDDNKRKSQELCFAWARNHICRFGNNCLRRHQDVSEYKKSRAYRQLTAEKQKMVNELKPWSKPEDSTRLTGAVANFDALFQAVQDLNRQVAAIAPPSASKSPPPRRPITPPPIISEGAPITNSIGPTQPSGYKYLLRSGILRMLADNDPSLTKLILRCVVIYIFSCI